MAPAKPLSQPETSYLVEPAHFFQSHGQTATRLNGLTAQFLEFVPQISLFLCKLQGTMPHSNFKFNQNYKF